MVFSCLGQILAVFCFFALLPLKLDLMGFTFLKNEVCRGYGGFGALGHSVFTRELVPRMVEGPWTEKIKHIATSGTHTAAITESGALDALCLFS